MSGSSPAQEREPGSMDAVKQFARTFEDDCMISIILEGSDRTYKVQKAVLVSASAYFEKALDGAFEESAGRVLRLPGCESDILEVFLYWLCHKALPGVYEETAQWPKKKVYAINQEMQKQLVRLWAFGDAYLLPKLQNQTVMALIELLDNAESCDLSVDAVRQAFALTPPGSALRKAMALAVAHGFFHNSFTGKEQEALGAIPGLLAPLANEFVKCVNGTGWTCEHARPAQEVLIGRAGWFRVPEEEEGLS